MFRRGRTPGDDVSSTTEIEWTDATWNPIAGCSRVSAGCVNCYAERIAARFSGPGQPYAGLATMTGSGPRWTGEVRLDKAKLGLPFKWRRPRRIFVNSMSDLFHPRVHDEWIVAVLATIAAAPWHTFQVLTKRASRLAEWSRSVSHYPEGDRAHRPVMGWPPNAWVGVSVENREHGRPRIEYLRRMPARVRFLSIEPLLEDIGPIDLTGIGWVIVGGETGPRARPVDPDWIDRVIDQCRRADVPCFVKNTGARKIPFEQWPAEQRVREFPA